MPVEAPLPTFKERVTEQLEPTVDGGMQEVGENETVTPEGRPVTFVESNETADGVPEFVVTVIV